MVNKGIAKAMASHEEKLFSSKERELLSPQSCGHNECGAMVRHLLLTQGSQGAPRFDKQLKTK